MKKLCNLGMFVFSSFLLFTLTACNQANDGSSSSVDLEEQPLPAFENQTAPEQFTLPSDVDILSTIGEWQFWNVDKPYLSEGFSENVSVGEGVAVTLTTTGFTHNIHEMRNALLLNDDISSKYDFADIVQEKHMSNILDIVGPSTTFNVTSSINGILKDNHTEFKADYDDMSIGLSQSFSGYSNPNEIRAVFSVDDLTNVNQKDIYNILAITFGPDYAQYFVCNHDEDGVDTDGHSVITGNFDDEFTVGVCDYRFTRTIKASDSGDGYEIIFTGQASAVSVDSSYAFYSSGYKDAYSNSPVKLSSLFADASINDYNSQLFDSSFDTYFKQCSNPLGDYYITMPVAFSYYEMQGRDDSHTTVYSGQMSFYGVNDEFVESDEKLRYFDASYAVTVGYDDIQQVIIRMDGQTSVMDSTSIDESTVKSVAYNSVELSLQYFMPELVLTEVEPTEDVSDEFFYYTGSYTILDEDYTVNVAVEPVYQDGLFWCDWILNIDG